MQAEVKAESLVFVDESGCNLALTPRYGWAPRGERAVAQAPRNRGPNTTVLAALTPEGLQASRTVEGAANTEVFLTYLDKVLCPSLHAGQAVVMDNLGRAPGRRRAGTHRSSGVPVGVFAFL